MPWELLVDGALLGAGALAYRSISRSTRRDAWEAAADRDRLQEAFEDESQLVVRLLADLADHCNKDHTPTLVRNLTDTDIKRMRR